MRGFRLLHVHRADLQQVLYNAAVERGITLRLGCPVVAIEDEDEDEENVAVVIEGGERIEADVIVGADGKSTTKALRAALMRFSVFVICVFVPISNAQILTEHWRTKGDLF
jgi:2-polyprenyl-6-methoxyphenol hydroxylase-like FAD-dependent oxidoreductase